MTNALLSDTPDADGLDAGPGVAALYREICLVIDRAQRRFADALGTRLYTLGFDDISPAQALMLHHIANGISHRQLMERGYYLGSSASYSLKGLADNGYIDRVAHSRDRRTSAIQLTERGRALIDAVKDALGERAASLTAAGLDARDLRTALRVLGRMEHGFPDLAADGAAIA